MEFLGFIVLFFFRGGVWDNFLNCLSMWFILLLVIFEFDGGMGFLLGWLIFRS